MYGLIITVSGKSYLELSRTDSSYQLSAYNTVGEIEEIFSAFKRKLHGYGYEAHISSSMGLINLRPQVIKFPDNPELMRKYLVDDSITHLKGQVHGAFLSFHGVLVNEYIKEIFVTDIAHNFIWNEKSPIP